MKSPLPLEFYRRDTATVARDMLGCRLVRILEGARLSGVIVETEAYVGADDRACHGFGGRPSPRTAPLFESGGITYIYFVYGMHWCLNAVTHSAGSPEAVLIRALRPTEGTDRMRTLRHAKTKIATDISVANGPAKLCQALAIDGALNRASLTGLQLWIEPRDQEILDEQIVSSPRIGVDYAGPAALWPLRFYLRDEPCVSRAKLGFSQNLT